MTVFERTPGPAGAVSVKIPFTITGADVLRDSVRSLFTPEEAVVTFRDGRPSWVEVKGFRIKKHHWTTGGFGVDVATGEVRADDRNEVPQWIRDMVEQAAQHPAVFREFVPAKAA